jgi:UDP-N-acetylglucosamine enolpyruvyl transferase
VVFCLQTVDKRCFYAPSRGSIFFLSLLEKLVVTGGKSLKGRVAISGSKNSSLPILAATLLTQDQCRVRRVPDLSDTNYMTQILAELGAEVERHSGTVIVEAKKIKSVAPYDLVRKMRASICVLGPLTAWWLRDRGSPGGFAFEGARGAECADHGRWRGHSCER